jgi:hypothetical protein
METSDPKVVGLEVLTAANMKCTFSWVGHRAVWYIISGDEMDLPSLSSR